MCRIWVKHNNNYKRKPEKLQFPGDTIQAITRILNWRIHQENLHHTALKKNLKNQTSSCEINVSMLKFFRNVLPPFL